MLPLIVDRSRPPAPLPFDLLHFRRVVSHTFLSHFPLTLSASVDDYRKLRVSAETILLSFRFFHSFRVRRFLLSFSLSTGSIFSLFFFLLSYHYLFSTLCINTKY